MGTKADIVSLLKRLQRIPPGSQSYLEVRREILEKAKQLGRQERIELQLELESLKSQVIAYRPSYCRPDYFRFVTILTNRLRGRIYQEIKEEIEKDLAEVEAGMRRNHFPRYPSSYVKRMRSLLIEAGRSGEADASDLARLTNVCDEMIDAIYEYEYWNVEVEVTSTRIKVSSLFTLGESQRSWTEEFISPELEYGGRTFLKREVLAYVTRTGKQVSRREIEEGIGKKIRYFGHIIQSLMRKYLVVPIPGENKYELTGTGRKVGEIYIRILDRTGPS